jgi:hypothetical protein
MRIEETILSNLIFDETYCRKVAPFIKPEYFADRNESVLAEEILKFFSAFNKAPTKEILGIEIGNRKDLNDKEVADSNKYLSALEQKPINDEWIISNTEQFCKDKAVYNAILRGISIIDGRDKHNTPDAIPSILSDALAVSFDQHVGHDYIADADYRRRL